MNYKRKGSKVQAIQLTDNVSFGKWGGVAGDWLVIDYHCHGADDQIRTYTDKLFKETFELDIPKTSTINQPYIGIRTMNLLDAISNKQLGPINPLSGTEVPRLFPFESTCFDDKKFELK